MSAVSDTEKTSRTTRQLFDALPSGVWLERAFVRGFAESFCAAKPAGARNRLAKLIGDGYLEQRRDGMLRKVEL